MRLKPTCLTERQTDRETETERDRETETDRYKRGGRQTKEFETTDGRTDREK